VSICVFEREMIVSNWEYLEVEEFISMNKEDKLRLD